ncbi:MAG: DUF4249 domain-containing protein [Prolixibacteraceae bacterium]|jgi:hypothetical protein|nr:DUF4249 domain-containing protein [Prolixibacteraceae bacterium]
MKNTAYVLIALLGLIVSFACQRDFDVELSYDQQILVINGIWVADSTPVVVQVYKLKGLSDSVPNEFVTDAEVKVFANNQLLGEMQHNDSGKYVMDLIPESGITYKVEIQQDKQTKVWAETTIPSPVPVLKMHVDSIASSSISYNPVFRLSLEDYKNELNYYWFTLQLLHKESLSFNDIVGIYSNSPYFDDFNRGIDPERIPPFNTEYGFMARIPDVNFTSDTCTVDLCSAGSGDFYGIYVFNVDENYDKYLKSSIRYRDYSDMVEDLPYYYQPSFIYSNVNNGVGIFGSMTIYRKVVNFYGGFRFGDG